MNSSLPDIKKNGFTLIELIGVLAIILILAAFLMPAVSKIKASANTVRCASNLRQIGVATQAYCRDNNGAFPYVYSWGTTNLYWPFSISLALDGEYNINNMPWFLSAKEKNIFNCPESGKLADLRKANSTMDAGSSYMVNGNLFVLDGTAPQVRLGVVKRPAQTVMMADSQFADMSKYQYTFVYQSDLDLNSPLCHLGTPHNGGANILFVDGHIERITKTTPTDSFILYPQP